MEKNQTIPEKEETEEKYPTIEEAKAILKEIKAANEEKKALLEREEKMHARAMLSGKAMAGQPQGKKEETPKEYAARIMRGGK